MIVKLWTVSMMSLRIKLRSSFRKTAHQAQHTEKTCDESRRPEGKSRRALYMQTYRRKMKVSRTEKWQTFKADEAARLRNYRQNISEEKRKVSNERAKMRMRAIRQRKKNTAKPDDIVSNRLLTRSTSEKKSLQQERWRQLKQAQRARMSRQKKRRIAEKDAARKRKKRAEIEQREIRQQVKYNSIHATPTESAAFPSASAKRQALKRARPSIPHSIKGAEVIFSLIKSASPDKRKELEKMGVTVTTRSILPMQDICASVRKTVGTLHRKKKRYFANRLSANLDKQHGLMTKTYCHLGFQPKFMMKYSTLTASKAEGKTSRLDGLNIKTQQSVDEFYRRMDVSTEMPSKKGLGPNADEPKRVLNRTVAEVHKSFLEEHPDLKIGRAKFSLMRPKSVLLQNKAKLHQCLCECCTNMD